MGGYFFRLNDKTATINVLKEIGTVNASNTVISSPPFTKTKGVSRHP